MAKIGFHINYHNRDQTILALCMANQAQKCCHEITILSRGSRAKKVHAEWDNKILNHNKVDFKHWLARLDLVVWTDTPTVDLLITAKRAGVRTALVCIWPELSENDKDIYKSVDVILSPIMQAILWLRDKWRLPKVFYYPVDLDLPVTRKPAVSSKLLNVYMPISGSQINNVEFAAFDVIKWLVAQQDNLRLTLTTSKKFSAEARHILEQLKASHEMIEIIEPDYFDELKQYMKADLTVRCCIMDGSGLVFNSSAIMGTPVYTFDSAPVREFVGSDVRGILSPCDLDPEQPASGVPMAKPDYEQFIDGLSRTVNDRNLINQKHAPIDDQLMRMTKLSLDGLVLALEG